MAMKFLTKLWDLVLAFDLWILDKCQKFSDWITRKTGIGKANCKIAYIFLSLFVTLITVATITSKKFSSEKIVIPGLAFLAGMIYYYILKKTENADLSAETRKNPQSLIRNRIETLIILLLCALLTPIFEKKLTAFQQILSISSYFSMIMCIYFFSVSGLPPEKGKIKNWIKSLLRIRKPAPAKVPTKNPLNT